VDVVGVELADLDQLLDLDDRDLAGLGAQRVEVARGLAEHQVAPAVAAPRLDDREVAADRVLQHAAPAVDLAGLLAIGDLRAEPGRRVERLDPRAPRAQPLGERALRTQLDLELAGQELLLEDLVLADVRRHHALDLALREQQAEALVGRAAVVGHDREVLDLLARQLAYAILGVARQAEAAGEDHRAIADVVQRCLRIRVDLVHRIYAYRSRPWRSSR
jgi:hypothetical protein